jgi:hypothetical protein
MAFEAFYCMPGIDGVHEKAASKVRSAIWPASRAASSSR